LVKTWEMGNMMEIEGRKYPMRMKIIDEVKKGSYTEIVTSELSFGVELEDEVFSLRWLERK